MDVSRGLADYRIAVIHSENAVRLLAILLREGPLQEEELCKITRLGRREVQKLVDSLAVAAYLTRTAKNCIEPTDVGDLVLRSIGAHEALLDEINSRLTSNLAHRAVFRTCALHSADEAERADRISSLNAIRFVSSSLHAYESDAEDVIRAAYAVSGSQCIKFDTLVDWPSIETAAERESVPSGKTSPEGGLAMWANELAKAGIQMAVGSGSTRLVLLNACKSAGAAASSMADLGLMESYWHDGHASYMRCIEALRYPSSAPDILTRESDKILLLARLWNYAVFRKHDPFLFMVTHSWDQEVASSVWKSCLKRPAVWQRSAKALWRGFGVSPQSLEAVVGILVDFLVARTESDDSKRRQPWPRAAGLRLSLPPVAELASGRLVFLLQNVLEILRQSTLITPREVTEVKMLVREIDLELEVRATRQLGELAEPEVPEK